MSDSTTNTDTETVLLKLLLEQLQQQNTNNKNNNNSISTVTTLWIVLFSVIVLQKIFKYIVKPVHRHFSAVSTRHNSSDNSDHSHDNHNL